MPARWISSSKGARNAGQRVGGPPRICNIQTTKPYPPTITTASTGAITTVRNRKLRNSCDLLALCGASFTTRLPGARVPHAKPQGTILPEISGLRSIELMVKKVRTRQGEIPAANSNVGNDLGRGVRCIYTHLPTRLMASFTEFLRARWTLTAGAERTECFRMDATLRDPPCR